VKKLILLFTFWSVLFCCPVYAQNSYDAAINPKLKDIYEIVNTPIYEKNYLVIDYAIEVLKKDLGSIDCYFALSGLKNIKIDEKNLINKYTDLKNKYFSDIDNLDDDFAEKVVLISIWGSGIDAQTDEDAENTVNRIIDILTKNLESSKDRKKAAIINLMLTHDKNKTMFYVEKFLKNFSDHPAVPFINLWKYKVDKKESASYINEVNEWIKKYGELYTPLGWKYKVDGYFDLANHYIEIKEYDKSKDMIKKIINESKDYLIGELALTYEGFINGTVEITIGEGTDL